MQKKSVPNKTNLRMFYGRKDSGSAKI